jgi:hypothetical protein
LLDIVEVSVPQQVAVSLVLFLIQKFTDEALVWNQQTGVYWRLSCVMRHIEVKGPVLSCFWVESFLVHTVKLLISLVHSLSSTAVNGGWSCLDGALGWSVCISEQLDADLLWFDKNSLLVR